MAHKTLIDGTAYEITGGRTLVDGTGYGITNGRTLVDGTVYDVSFGTQIGSLPVGSTVYLNESGSPVEYLVVHQGLPSAMYDDSCNGTWLLRENIIKEISSWASSRLNDYENSDINEYLCYTYLKIFTQEIQNIIKLAKIPYRPGSGTSGTVNSGANGFPVKAFALSAVELGGSGSYFPVDGAKLDYFVLGNTDDAKVKRVSNFNGNAFKWATRSPAFTAGSSNAVFINSSGGLFGNYSVGRSIGIRPAIILPSNIKIDDYFNVIA